MVARALSFGAVAAEYERFRPGYPSELVDTVLAYAGRPVLTALEIGAGTGKATRAFAHRGIAVTATDPDGAMLRELRNHVPPHVITVQASLESLQAAETYGLVFAAAALHWTDPAERWARIGALVEPNGVFASFGGQFLLAERAVEDAALAARTPFLEDDAVAYPGETHPDGPLKWPGTELEQAEAFTDVRQSLVERRLTLSNRQYVGYLSTVSAYLQLPVSYQEEVFRRTLRVLPGQVDVIADVVVHLARRRPERS